MNQLPKLNELNSNVFFLLPLIASTIYGDVVYMSLSISILCASTYFHYLHVYHFASVRKVKLARWMDRIIATLSFAYMFYFVYTKVTVHQLWLYGGLLLSIVVYLLSKHESGKQKDLHTYFHVVIGVVSGAIPLVAMI